MQTCPGCAMLRLFPWTGSFEFLTSGCICNAVGSTAGKRASCFGGWFGFLLFLMAWEIKPHCLWELQYQDGFFSFWFLHSTGRYSKSLLEDLLSPTYDICFTTRPKCNLTLVQVKCTAFTSRRSFSMWLLEMLELPPMLSPPRGTALPC